MRNVIQIRIRIQDYGSATLLVSLAIEQPDSFAGGEVLVVIVVLLPLNDHLHLPRLRVRHYVRQRALQRNQANTVIVFVFDGGRPHQRYILRDRRATRYDFLPSLLDNGSGLRELK